MRISLAGIVIIVGNYGSGKTEVAVNLAVQQNRLGTQVKIADLDLVNPYFRTREARRALNDLGIDVILPPDQLLQADLPILVPQVAGLLRSPGELAILDVGGEDAGATVLASLADVFKESRQPVATMQVINPFRPNTETVEGCLRMRRIIEGAARRPVDRWVGNTHLLDETIPAHLYEGHSFMEALSETSSLDVAFLTAPHHLLPQIDMSLMKWPVLPIHRQLVPPWRQAEQFPESVLSENGKLDKKE